MPKRTHAQRLAALATNRSSRVRLAGDTAIVDLTRGYHAVVDAADAPLVANYSWYALVQRRRDGSPRVYAQASMPRVGAKRRRVMLHRLILGLTAADRFEVDHADGDGLNNKRSNLRVATRSENAANRRVNSNNRLQVKGVCLRPGGKFEANIKVNGELRYLGCFETVEEAAAAYNHAALKRSGDFARLSTIPTSKPPSSTTPDKQAAIA
jgi:hypothetical protein